MNPLPFFQCSFQSSEYGNCDFYTKKISETAKHMKKEHGITDYKPYVCKHCKTAWGDIANYCRHVRTHYQQNVMCNICGKELSPGSLQHHIAR